MVGVVGIHCTSRGCPEGGPWHDVYAVTSYLTDERKQILGGNGSATAQERKALAIMGRKGGQKAAERWNDRNSEYARTELAKLKNAYAKRTLSGGLLEAEVKAAILEARTQEVADPSTKELAETLGVSVRRVQQVRKLWA